jgi:alkylation response protein AidB-like acyl-CoA dehydrogenase
MPSLPPIPETLLAALRDRAGRADAEDRWPAESLRLLDATDAWRWSIPPAFGGAEWSSPDLLAAYEDLSAACLTVAFILSQRDAALRRLVAFASPALKGELLPRLAAGEWFTTIGLSQLTTSRQHVRPPLLVTANPSGGFLLHGEIPWVTGADRASFIVIGAKDAENRQYLFALPTDRPGVTVEPPMDLMALAGSRTARLQLEQVTLDAKWRLVGPVAEIPGLGRGGTGGLETSCLALGLARAAIEYLEVEAGKRAELGDVVNRLTAQHRQLRDQMLGLARGEQGVDAGSLRADANQLVLAATQIALVAAKGAGYVRGHPVERWVRQALFFLVWSCPRTVQQQVIDAQVSGLCD